MNRDEKDAAREDVTGIDTAKAVALGALPAEILAGDVEAPLVDVQTSVDTAVSRATGNRRQWDRQTLMTACKAARPIVENDFRRLGKAFTRDEVRAGVRTHISAYTTKYNVTLPSSVVLGATPLEAVAADVCGSLSWPWTYFMPKSIQDAASLAQKGNPKAASYLKKLFGQGAKVEKPVAAANAPATPATSASATAPATETSGNGKTILGRSFWSNIAVRPANFNQSNRSWNRNSSSSYPNDGTQRRRRHHRRNRRNGQYGQRSTGYNQYGQQPGYNQYGQPGYNQYGRPGNNQYGQPGYNPAVSQTQISEYNAAHQPASASSSVNNPYLSTYTPPAATSATTDSTSTQSDDSIIYGSGDSLGATLGAWLHQLNPLYWIKSKEQRDLIDKERQAWIDNAELQKKANKKQEVLTSAQKASEAQQAVAAAKARSAEIEAQLKSVESQLSGACSSSSMGTIGPAEIVGFAEIIGRDGSRKENPFEDNLPAADVAPVLAKVKKARSLNDDNAKELAPICAKMQNGQPLSPAESSKVLILLARNEQLHEFRKNLMSGETFASNPSRNKIQRHVVLGAVKAMTPNEQQMMAQIVSLSKQGNANAQKALAALQAQGYAVTMGYAPPTARIGGKSMTPSEQTKLAALIKAAKQKHPGALRAIALLNTQGYKVSLGTDTYIGWGIDDAFKLALKPVTVPLKYLWKGTKKVAQAVGITHGSKSAEQVRLDRLKAAQQRRRAAQARARAADAQSEAEYRAQQQLASAADAEADAADAEATSKEAAMLTAEAQYLPGQTDEEASAASQATDSSGATRPVVTPLPPTPGAAPSAIPEIKKARRARVAKKNPLAARILSKSEEDTPAGIKLRASMELYKKAEKRKSKERKAVAAMVAKAKKGDKQALADVQALKAAGLAVKADRAAGKHVARVAAYRATEKRVKATRMKAEVAMAQKGIELSRSHQLKNVARLEKSAAAGNPKSIAIVKNQVAKAKAGDPGAKKVVAALVLSKHARITASSPRERRNLRQANRLAARAARGDKKALAQINVINSAAQAGNPNAKRAQNRIQTAAAVRYAVKTGTFVLPAVVVTSKLAKKREDAKKRLAAKRAKDQALVAQIDAKIKAGTATRGEVLAASRASANLGDKAAASSFMAVATAMPSKKPLAKGSKDYNKAKAQVFAAKQAADKGAGTREQIQQGAMAAAAVGAPVTAGELMAASASHPSKDEAPLAVEHKKVSAAQDKIAAKTASREEALAGAKAAADMGDKERAAELTTAAATLPSSKEELSRVATVAAAARAGNPAYTEQVARAQELAASGDPRGVEAMGKITGVQALDQVSRGKDIDPPMKEAVRDLQAAKDGDQAAAAKIEEMKTRAATGDPKAVKYAVYAAGAAAVASAVANNPPAETEWLRKAGVKAKDGSKDDVRIVDAEIVTPLSSLPDQPLPPITTVFGVIREGLAALVCATRNPFQNYREGVIAKGTRGTAPASSAGEDLSLPTDKFVRSIMNPIVRSPEELLAQARQEAADVKIKTWRRPYPIMLDESLRRDIAPGKKVQESLILEKRIAFTSSGPRLIINPQNDGPNLIVTMGSDDGKGKLVADTKARLSLLANKATSGDKVSQKKWETAKTNYETNKKRASGGDPKAKAIVEILEATGLFVK
jgi:hypothetical protein